MSDFPGETTEGQGPVSSFQSMAAEADLLAKSADYRKAVEAYSKALQLRPSDKNVLVARSRCYLALGENQLAYEDAEASLAEDKDFFKGKFQKAEALYAKGDFEMALVFYHRGHLLRPELDEFRLGIQKAREAIDNSIGNKINPRDYRPKGGKFAAGSDSLRGETKRGAGVGPTQQQNAAGAPFGAKVSAVNERTTKQLLGELYEDKVFLESIYHDRDFVTNPNEAVRQLVFEGLKFLEARTEFWRQQKPLYARKKEHMRSKPAHADSNRHAEAEQSSGKNGQALDDASIRRKYGFDSAAGAAKWVEERWVGVNRALENGSLDKAERLAKNFLFDVTTKDQKAVEVLKHIANKPQLLCNLYATLGTVHQQSKHTREAESWNKKELAMARQHQFKDSQSRALGNLGRIYVQQAQYTEAVKCWEEKLALVAARPAPDADAASDAVLNNAIEVTWLHHDIAKCYLALQAASPKDASLQQKVEQHAQQAFDWATKATQIVAVPGVPLSRLIQEDKAAAEAYRWLLFAIVVKAQAMEKKGGGAKEAKDEYQTALELAKNMEDTSASEAIQAALSAVNV